MLNTLCRSGIRCADQIDGHPRETGPDEYCTLCLHRITRRIEAMPEQYLRLHAILGERHAGLDAGIRRAKPSASVPLNLHVDTLLSDIVYGTTMAAEIICDRWGLHAYPHHRNAMVQVGECCAVITLNIDRLVALGGIDIMFWTRSGCATGVSATTGTAILGHLDRLSSYAHHALGLALARIKREFPCARCGSDQVGRWAGKDEFDCLHCGSRFSENDIDRQGKILVALVRRGIWKDRVA
jgi:DNA-directed RNA polymerase subunit RPC12/RpoP